MDKFIKTLAQFIQIIIIFLLLSFASPFVTFSYSILGKLMAVIIIIFYTYLDKMVGLFVCGLFILYYQSDFLENMLNMNNENMTNYKDLYDNNENANTNTKAQDQFREQNCVNHNLKYKDMNVKADFAEHVFPELQYKNDTCNPCNRACKFSIIESKSNTEKLMIPKSTN